MKIPKQINLLGLPSATLKRVAVLGAVCGLVLQAGAQLTIPITNNLVAYWPFSSITGPTTPDVVGGYNMTLSGSGGLPAIVATTPPASTAGPTSAMQFVNTHSETVFYLAQATDQMPVTKNIAFTINFWVNANATNNNNNVYAFAEDNNANGGIYPASSNPLFCGGMVSGSPTPTDTDMRWLLRDQGVGAGGVVETPSEDNTQPQAGTTNAVFDGNWHMITVTEDTNFDYALYVDGKLDGGQGYTDYFGNPSVLGDRPGTNTVNSTLWTWDTDCTSFGGLSRGTPGANTINGMVALASFWTRTLTNVDVMYLYTNGLSTVTLPPGPPKINAYTADFTNVVSNGYVTLRWNTANSTDIKITPSVGSADDVTGISSFGVGSTALQVTASPETFTLSCSASGKSTATQTITVYEIPQAVAAGWVALQNFNALATNNPISGDVGIAADQWASVGSDFSGDLGLFNVVQFKSPTGQVNNVLGEDPVTATNQAPAYTISGDLAGLSLNSESFTLGNQNTLFFRFYITDSNYDNSDLWLSLGLTWHSLSPSPQDFQGGDGPGLFFTRTAQGIVDLASPNGVTSYNEGLTSSPYSVAVSGNGLPTGTVMDVWMDVSVNPETYPLNSDGTTNQLGTTYSVYIKPDSAAGPALELFTNQYSDVDFVNLSAAGYGQATTNLVNLWLAVYAGNIAVAGTNNIVVDDFYESSSGYLHTVPVAAGYFPPGYSFDISSESYLPSDPANGNKPSMTVTWNSALTDYGVTTYSVHRSTKPGVSADAVVLASGIPSGGTSGSAPALTTSYTDDSPPAAGGYYWITSP